MNRDIAEQALRNYAALRSTDTDPELEAVRIAILVEDLFDVVLSDAEIELAMLADASAVTALVARLRGAV